MNRGFQGHATVVDLEVETQGPLGRPSSGREVDGQHLQVGPALDLMLGDGQLGAPQVPGYPVDLPVARVMGKRLAALENVLPEPIVGNRLGIPFA